MSADVKVEVVEDATGEVVKTILTTEQKVPKVQAGLERNLDHEHFSVRVHYVERDKR